MRMSWDSDSLSGQVEYREMTVSELLARIKAEKAGDSNGRSAAATSAAIPLCALCVSA